MSESPFCGYTKRQVEFWGSKEIVRIELYELKALG